MTYQQKKQEIRDEAIEWTMKFYKTSKSWSDIAKQTEYFEKQGRKYGLLREFRENGIC